MTRRALLLAGTAALLAAPASAQDASDFRLQPAPTPTPQTVGPPPDTPAPRPSATPTPVPTPSPTATLPPPTPTPRVVLSPAPSPSATPTPAAPERSATARPTPRSTGSAPAENASPNPLAPPSPTPAPLATATAAPAPSLPSFPAAAAPEPPARSWWPWIVAVFLLGGAAFGALLWLRRRVGPMGPLVVPEIERPKVPPAPIPEPQFGLAAAAAPAPAQAPPEPEVAAAPEEHPLHIAIELRKLTLTLLNATLGYRLTLTNAGPEPLREIAVAADLIGAHASVPRETQLAGTDTELPLRHLLAGLAPGESGDVAGELRVPLSEVLPIAQGRAQLFVPLARFRIGAEGEEPRCFTLVAGQPSPSGTGALQPVRLDHGPRIYDGLAGRAF